MRLRSVLFGNVNLKFLALVLAIGLWFTATGRESAEIGLTVPLELINYPTDMTIVGPVPDGIGVRIRGSVTLARQMASRSLRFSLDLSGADPGENEFNLSADSLDLPRGVAVTRLAPSTITVTLEKLAAKTVTVLPVIRGEPAPGFLIEDLILEPNQVSVQGPESVLAGVEILWTQPIDVSGLEKSAELTTRASLPDHTLSLSEPLDMKAVITIAEKIHTKLFPDLPVNPYNTEYAVRIEPPTVDLTIRGPVGTIEHLAPGKGVNVRVDLAGLGPGPHRVPVEVQTPPDVEVYRKEPDHVTATIIKEGHPSSQ
jgi:YbbR domain-containing protein